MPQTPARPADTVVGLGASAGGIEPLCTVLRGLSPDLDAAVLVVVHLSAAAPSVLDRILGRCCRLPVVFAWDGAPLEAGRVYVAPADWHMQVTAGRIALNRGPTVNAVRPSIDVLFRSMADECGVRAVGVILSGTRQDGAAGLHAIGAAGGHTVVQDPDEAVFPGMPNSARHLADPDDVVGAEQIPGVVAAALDRLASPSSGSGPAPAPGHPEGAPAEDPDLDDPAAGDLPAGDPASERGERHPAGEPSELACPECGGVLWEEPGAPLSFRCRIGHAYSIDSLVGRHSQKLEDALWSAVVALEERADLFRRMSRRVGSAGNRTVQLRYEHDAAAACREAEVLRAVVVALESPPSPAD